jgi:class 3 adenylate cyclase
VTLLTGNVTFLFTDIEGSTRLREADRAAIARVVTRHDPLLRTTIERHGRQVFKDLARPEQFYLCRGHRATFEKFT